MWDVGQGLSGQEAGDQLQVDRDAGHHVDVAEEAATADEGFIGFLIGQGPVALIEGQALAVAPSGI